LAGALPVSLRAPTPGVGAGAVGEVDAADELDSAAGANTGRGAGKLPFLSTASTSRWKRLNRTSARMRVELRSMVHESSLTNRRQLAWMKLKCQGGRTYCTSAPHQSA
jgi:hypothetical protein